MGIVWEAYHKGVPLLGSLESSLNKRATFFEATKNGMIFDTSGSAEKVLKNPEWSAVLMIFLQKKNDFLKYVLYKTVWKKQIPQKWHCKGTTKSHRIKNKKPAWFL